MSSIDIQRLKDYVRDKLEGRSIIDSLEEMVARSPSVEKEREGVFTRKFLCPTIRDFFYEHVRQELNLSDEKISEGLGAENYKECPGFGFTPARKEMHLFRKSDVLKASPPEGWRATEKNPLPRYQACPDFAIKRLLASSIVGEVKYLRSNSPEGAVRELYNVSRQAVFYLGAFHGEYDSALIVMADASKEHSFFEGLRLIKPKLLERFGPETNIHLLSIRLN